MTTLERIQLLYTLDGLTDKVQKNTDIINRINTDEPDESKQDLKVYLQIENELISRNIETVKNWIITDKIDY
jgi:hypothetical protein